MARSITVALELDDGNFRRGIKRSEGAVDSLSSSLGGLKTILAGLTTGFAVKGIIDATLKMENFRSTLTAYLGTQELANQALDGLSALAKTLPQELDDVTESFIILQRNGITATSDTLTAFAKVAAGNSKSMGQLSEALADALTGEFERLKEFGVKVSKENDKFVLRMADGSTKIVDSTQAVIDAVRAQGEEGGKFADVVAGPLNQAFSNLRGVLLEVASQFGDGLAPALTDASSAISTMLEDNKDLIASMGRLVGERLALVLEHLNLIIPAIIGFGAAWTAIKIGGIVTALRNAGGAMAALNAVMAANPIGAVATAIGILVGGMVLLTQETGSFEHALKTVANRGVEVVKLYINTWKAYGTFMIEYFKSLGVAIWDYLTGGFDGDAFVNTMADAFGRAGEAARQAFISNGPFDVPFEIKPIGNTEVPNITPAGLPEIPQIPSATGTSTGEIPQTAAQKREAEALKKKEEVAQRLHDNELARANAVISKAQAKAETDLAEINLIMQKVGLSRLEREQLDSVTALEAERRDALAEIAQFNITEQEKNDLLAQTNSLYDEQIKKMREAIDANYELQTQFSTGWTEALTAYLDELADTSTEGSKLFSTMSQGMEDSLVNFVKTGKLSFKGLIDDMINQMIRMFVQQQIMAPIMGLFGGGGDLLGSLFGGFRAEGGPVMPNKAYIVGEKGPELFMPRGAGTIIPNNQMKPRYGSSVSEVEPSITNVNYTINAVDTRSFRQLIAEDAEFIYGVTQRGARRLPR